ncbi:MAG: hypothetical protein WBM74_10345, partial [Polyangiales bacterium]
GSAGLEPGQRVGARPLAHLAGGATSGLESIEESAQTTAAPKSSSGMISAHQGLGLGGALDGISLRRHNSHSPFLSSGS